ncbi:MAG: 7-cyano-7-deazaguanine synthase QueC [Candidatus Margulisiibacteriota bacterium]
MKSICLLSGGLDSLVSLAAAKKETDVILALTFDYGQRSFRDENESASKISAYYKVPHKTIKLDWLKEITHTALVDKSKTVPVYTEKDLEANPDILQGNARLVWVPNRNAVFVNIAASYAEALGAELIVSGFNSEEAATFSDNSLQFTSCANALLRVSTLSRPRLVSYVQSFNKSGIVNTGVKLNVPFKLFYSCYHVSKNGIMCGECESCARIKRAFRDAGKFAIVEKMFV